MERTFRELVRDLDAPDGLKAAATAKELARRGGWRAAWALRRSLRRALRRELGDPERRLRAEAALRALRRLPDDSPWDFLRARRDQDPEIRTIVLRWHAPAFMTRTPHQRQGYIRDAAELLAPHVDALFGELDDEDDPEHLYAAQILARIGGPDVERRLRDRSSRPGGSVAADVGLAYLGDAHVLPRLVDALDSNDRLVLQAVLAGLGELGCAATDSLPRIRDLARRTRNRGVREAAREAEWQITSALRRAPAELEAAAAPGGRGTEPEAAPIPQGRGTELCGEETPSHGRHTDDG